MLRAGRVACVAVVAASSIVSAQIPVADNARIYWVGNSYTDRSGGLHEYVKRALAAGSPSITITVESNISGGKDIDYMYDSSGAVARIQSGDWDIVVVQGYWSGIDYPAGSLAMLQRYAAKFDSVITAAGAQMVLFMPWTGNPLVAWMGATKFHNDMVAFQTNYTALGSHLGVPVAPCGHVWHSLTDTLPPGNVPRDYLYADDIHPNNLAQYLNSWIFYAILTRRSPVGLDYYYTDVTNVTYNATIRTAMQERAWAIAQMYLPTGVVGPRVSSATPATVPQRMTGPRECDLRGRVGAAGADRGRGSGVLIVDGRSRVRRP